MSEIGLLVHPGDGGKPYRLDSDRAQTLSLIRTITIDLHGDYRKQGWKQSRHIPEAKDFHIVLIPIKTVMVGQNGNVSAIVDIRLTNIRMEGEYLRFEYSDSPNGKPDWYGNVTGWFDPFFERDQTFSIQVCGYPKPTGAFGIQLAGMNGIATLSDRNRLGYCVYRGKITLGKWGQWRVPAAIPNREQCLVFARTETPGAVVGMNHDKVIMNNDVPCKVYVVIFSSGFSLKKPDVGVAVYNAAGEMTYSSYYTPFFLGEMIPVRNGRGSASHIARPMVQVSRLAKLANDQGKGYWNFWDSGFSFSGHAIGVERAGKPDFQYFQVNWFSYKPINYDIYAINFDDYF